MWLTPSWWPADDLVPRATDGEGPAGRFALVVVLASWAAHFIVLGLGYSCGVVNRALLLDASFSGGDRGSAALIPAVSTASMLAAGVMNGALVERFGARAVARGGCALVVGGLLASSAAPSMAVLFAAYIVVGVGMCGSFAPSLFMVQRHFVRRRAFATGVAVSGSGVGTFVLGPITQLLIDRAGWRSALQALALLAAAVLALASCAFVPVRPPEPPPAVASSAASVGGGTAPLVSAEAPAVVDSATLDVAAEPKAVVANVALAAAAVPHDAAAPTAGGGTATAAAVAHEAAVTSAAAAVVAAPAADAAALPKLSLLEVWRSPAFAPLAGMAAVYGACLFVPYSHAVIFAGDLGLEPERAALIVSYMGIGNTLGRIVFGRIADLPIFAPRRVLLLQVTLTVAGLATAGLAAATTEAALAVWAVSFGALSGSMVGVTPVIVADYLGVDNVAHAMGGIYSVQAPTVLLGPPLAGFVRGVVGDYKAVWLGTGLLLTCAPLALGLMPRRAKR
jgi:MFS family permease